MGVEAKNDLKNFHDFVADQLANGGAELTPDQVLVMWRERVDTITAVREALDAVDAGRTKPLDEFSKDFRQRHGLSDNS
jgi:hypothetical protein